MEMDIFGMCRVCLNDSRAYSNVFEVLLSDNYLYEVLNDVCQLEVKSDDGLPQFLCCECYQKLAMFDSFKRLSHKGSATLHSLKSDLQHVQVKVEPDIYEGEYDREDSMEVDTKQCLEEVVIKNEPEDSLDFEENGRDERHGLDIRHRIKNEEPATNDEGSSPVQTELYMLPVKTEIDETVPAAGHTDPLKGVSDSARERLGVRVKQRYAEQRAEENEQLRNENMVHDTATNDGSDSLRDDGSGRLHILSLPNVNKADQNVSNDINKRQTVECEGSGLRRWTLKFVALKSVERNDRFGEFEGVDECFVVPVNDITTCINSRRSNKRTYSVVQSISS